MRLLPEKAFDIMGITGAFVCLIHCLCIPLLLVLQPIIFSSFKNLEGQLWWESLDYAFLIISAISVFFATRKAHAVKIKILFALAYTIFALGVLFEETLILLSYIGSFSLIALHSYNYRKHYVHHHSKVTQ